MFYHPPLFIIIRFTSLAISFVVALILGNYMGQQIIDKKNEVFHSAYFCSKWYIMPPTLRRLVLLISINATDCSGLSAGKMGDVSMEAAGIVSFIV